MHATIIIKLGGSAITDKSKTCTPRVELIHRIAGELASRSEQMVLLHGGGSFAHPFATRELVQRRFMDKAGLKAVSEIELNLEQLTRIVGVALVLHGRSFVPIRPMSFMTLRNGDVYKHFLRPLTTILRNGAIPLIHGDLCVDERGGFGVVSADRIASLLGQELSVSRVLFGCDVDGVYESKNRKDIFSEVTKLNQKIVLNRIPHSESDATGGMRGKVMEALRLARIGVESFIFNLKDPENLTQLLEGDSSLGTRFVPWR